MSPKSVENECRPIAESYDQLQGLSWLRRSTALVPLLKASSASFLRCVFQSVEISLLNLTPLFGQCLRALSEQDVVRTLPPLAWSYGFHSILNSLGRVVERMGLLEHAPPSATGISLQDSPAYRAYWARLLQFEAEARRHLNRLTASEESTLHHERLCQLLLMTHQTIITWEENLARFHPLPAAQSYVQFVGADELREMVSEFSLPTDTTLPQFRALHQIPEALGAEMADRVEASVRALRADRLPEAVEHLEIGNSLAAPIILCLEVMVENLSATEYHRIRENLGLTSGSHSVTFRFHLFEDLYQQLWQALAGFFSAAGDLLEERFREIDRQRFQDGESCLRSHLLTKCLDYRSFVRNWRDTHLHLPRCNLGSDGTRSLTGAHDAVTTVRAWRDRAAETDPMLPLARARGLMTFRPTEDLLMGSHLRRGDSLDAELLARLGTRTQRTFPQVQDRTGYFAHPCPFRRPGWREA